MGVLDVHRLSPGELRLFARALLRDVEALEVMLASGAIQTGHRRIGCEQEMFLVDTFGRPRPVAMEMLEALDDPHFTTELGRFNLEVNQDSLPLAGGCFSRMERELWKQLGRARQIGMRFGAEVALTGILPTLRKSDLGMENLTPLERYRCLNEAMTEMGGGRYELRLSGSDELIVMQDSVMLESCCTSFQIHYQTDPEDFVNVYNVAQLITAPVLAAAVNSPMLFGRKLWQETRIPLFQQAIDTRRAAGSLRERSPRVTFGDRWLEGSVVALFRDAIARLPILLGAHIEEDSLSSFAAGRLPLLRALQVHNGTVYRWNRACYGLQEGVAHLRIENRVLPAGPTVCDEVANAAFFFGLMYRLPKVFPEVSGLMEFEQAQLNFAAAARSGLESQLFWPGSGLRPARALIQCELLPLARSGLEEAGVAKADIETYLGIIEERVSTGRTGASWIMSSVTSMRGERREKVLSALTRATIERQWAGDPVHRWAVARLDEGQLLSGDSVKVEEAMTTDLLTVRPEEPLEMARALMEWRQVHHLPVEADSGELLGILSLDRVVALLTGESHGDGLPVGDVMEPSPWTIGPERSIREAAATMARENADYLVVVEDGRAAGILTRIDIQRVAPELMESRAP